MLTHRTHTLRLLLPGLLAAHLLAGGLVAQTAPSQEVLLINFYPNKKVEVTFTAEPAFPGAKGRVKVEINGGTATVEGDFNDLKSPFDIGGQYSAYVLWAIEGDGTPRNIAALNVKGKDPFVDSGVKVPVGLKRFGMILTAEPHYLVRTPSRVVVLRNNVPFGKNADVAQTDKVTVVLSENDYSRVSEKREKKAEQEYRKRPLLLNGAGYALELAKAAGAQALAPERYNQAESEHDTLDELWRQKAKAELIDQQARTTIETAAAAEKLARERKRERREAQEKSDTQAVIDDQEKQIDELTKEIGRVRNELSETRDSLREVERGFEEKRAQLERANSDVRQMSLESDKLKIENRKLEVNVNTLQQEVRRHRGARDFARDMPELKKFFANFGPVQGTAADGLTLTLPETIWMYPDSDKIGGGMGPNLDLLAQKIAEMDYLDVVVSSYRISSEDVVSEQAFAERRARAIVDFLTKAKISEDRIKKQALSQPDTTRGKKTGAPSGRIEILLRPLD